MVFAWCYHGALEELSRRCIHLHSTFMGSHYSSTVFLACYFYGLPWNTGDIRGMSWTNHGAPHTSPRGHGIPQYTAWGALRGVPWYGPWGAPRYCWFRQLHHESSRNSNGPNSHGIYCPPWDTPCDIMARPMGGTISRNTPWHTSFGTFRVYYPSVYPIVCNTRYTTVCAAGCTMAVLISWIVSRVIP